VLGERERVGSRRRPSARSNEPGRKSIELPTGALGGGAARSCPSALGQHTSRGRRPLGMHRIRVVGIAEASPAPSPWHEKCFSPVWLTTDVRRQWLGTRGASWAPQEHGEVTR
jgi:hypothetical protein